MKESEREVLLQKRIDEEIANNIETFIWMSFCDPEKPKGKQFLGVIITKSLGLAHAIQKTHDDGINPGGEIMSRQMIGDLNKDSLDRLLNEKDLRSFGYID